MGYAVKNKYRVVIDKHKLKQLLGDKTFSRFHAELVTQWGMGLGYKSFITLLDNRNTWSLTYAYMIAQHLSKEITDIFILVEEGG